MENFWVLSLCSLCIVSGNLQGKGFIKSTTLYFDEIQSSNQPKTLIECCGFCGTIDSCQGVKFDGKTCIAINNVLPNFRAVKENQAWLDFELFKKSQKVVLFSGSESGTEVIDVSFESSYILPDTFQGALGDKISDTEAMICAVSDALTCRYFRPERHHEFTTIHQDFATSRKKAAAIGLPEMQGLWIVGGENTDSTEIITKTGSQPGPPPPIPNTQKHCLVRINSTTIFSIGGVSQAKKTWFCHTELSVQPQDWKWIEGPQLQNSRKSHACAIWNIKSKKVVVVVGGYESIGGQTVGLTSTELLEMESTNQWIYGPNLEFKLRQSSAAQLFNGKQNEIFVFGGLEIGKGRVNHIFRLSCQDQNLFNTCSWITLPQKLQIPRFSGIVIKLL